MINAYVIRIKGDEYAGRAVRRLEDSRPTNVLLREFDAITPDQVDRLMKRYRLKWNYPWEGEEHDIQSGMIKRAYQTADPKKRIGCFISHYMLWERCIKHDEPMIIHEHDAIYYDDKPLPVHQFENSKYDIIGLNTPERATRLANVYHTKVQESEGDIVRAPEIDHYMVPQGIAGNSAYYINPRGASKMVSLTKEFGCWPNDALMCRQLVPLLGQTKEYYTYIQPGIQSQTVT